jgi:PhnB protein
MKGPVTYLNFDGNCRDAMKFYERCFGGELSLMTFGDMQGPCAPPSEMKDRIMHARLTKGSEVFLMSSDTMPGQGAPYQQGNNFWIMLPCESVEEVDRLFSALGQKGQVTMPLQTTFWAARFGMLTDQFGIHWMLNFDRTERQADEHTKSEDHAVSVVR